MRAVFWKELADYFGSWRFIILIVLICLVSLFATYTAAETVLDDVGGTPTESVFIRIFTTSGDTLPSLLFFLSFFGPFIGILFGFDAINSERNRGTLSRLLSQPLFRDSVISGKFLAGFTTVAIMLASIVLMASGLGLAVIGIPPSVEEIMRILVFYVISVVYVGLWLGIGMLFSVLFKRTIVSALAPFAIWIFFAVFMYLVAGVAASWIEPVDQYSQPEEAVRHQDIEDNLSLVSPIRLFQESSDITLDPGRRTVHGLTTARKMTEQQNLPDAFSPVSLKQSMTLIWPHIVTLMGLTVICFGISYVRFMREEIRST